MLLTSPEHSMTVYSMTVYSMTVYSMTVYSTTVYSTTVYSTTVYSTTVYSTTVYSTTVYSMTVYLWLFSKNSCFATRQRLQSSTQFTVLCTTGTGRHSHSMTTARQTFREYEQVMQYCASILAAESCGDCSDMTMISSSSSSHGIFRVA